MMKLNEGILNRKSYWETLMKHVLIFYENKDYFSVIDPFSCKG